MKNIKEVSELTGATASETDFLFSSAKRAGVEYDSMSQVMFQLSRRGAMLESTMAMMTNKVPGMAQKFRNLGVDMSRGPVKALETMSARVKEGKVDAGDLMAQFRVPRSQAVQFEEFLKKLDPKKLKAARAGKGGFITDEELEGFRKFEEAHHRIEDVWNRVKVTVAKNLFPVLADLSERFAKKLEAALPIAESVTRLLAENMDKLLFAAKSFVAIMTARKFLGVVEGLTKPAGFLGKLAKGGAGGFGALGSMMGMAGGGHGVKGGAHGGTGMLAILRTAVGQLWKAAPALMVIAAAAFLIYEGYQAIQKNLGGVADRLDFLYHTIEARLELIGERFDELFQSVESLFGGSGTLSEFVQKVASLGFEALVDTVDDYVHAVLAATYVAQDFAHLATSVWEKVTATFREARDNALINLQLMGESISSFFTKLVDWVKDHIPGASKLMEINARLADKINSKLSGGGGAFSSAANAVMGFNQRTADTIGKAFSDSLNMGPIGELRDAWQRAGFATFVKRMENDRLREKAKREKELGEKRPPSNQFDFRGSRFDITQNFAEGFDPDRIAVSFGNDLASLGELKTQSGFAPAFAVR